MAANSSAVRFREARLGRPGPGIRSLWGVRVRRNGGGEGFEG